jgi:uncharacterized protein YaeQ
MTETELEAAFEMLQRAEGDRAKVVVEQFAATLAHPRAEKFELRLRLRLSAFVKYARERL